MAHHACGLGCAPSQLHALGPAGKDPIAQNTIMYPSPGAVGPAYRTFRCKIARCLPEYLRALVSTEFFWARLKDATRGVGARRERTRPEQFLQLKFSMPSVEEQRQALKMFSLVRSVQSLQKQTFPELDAMLPAVIDRAFRDQL